MPRMYSKRDLPPCPDPEKYILVRAENKYYWRRKRGTVTPAVLNESFRRNANNTTVTSKAAREIVQKLAPFLERLRQERRIANIGGRLKKGLNENGVLDYSALAGYEVQKDHPLKSMLKTGFRFSVLNDLAKVNISLEAISVKPLNTLVTQYFFELILLSGELLTEQGLRVETDSSKLYNFYEKGLKDEVEMSMLLPETAPWMLILKLSCLEGRERAVHPKHHVMRVIGAGRGRVGNDE